MEIQELFEYILTEGCGVTLDSVLKSKSYQRLLQNQQVLFEKYPSNTDRGAMLRAGHLTGGMLLSCYPERGAKQQAKIFTSQYGHGVERRALITMTGRALIKAAKKNLPEEASVIAKKWKKATADEQVALTHELYNLFTSDDQRTRNIINSKNVLKLIEDQYVSEDMRNGPPAVLPKKYGRWNKQNNPANCQGKTQMIIAFAEMVGAKAMIMLPNVLGRDVLDAVKMEASGKIGDDIINRKIQFPDEEFMDSLESGMIKQSHHSLRSRSFHVCPVIQIKDGRWILIDSNTLNWGILSEQWGIEKLHAKLSKYKDTLPGLSLGAADYQQRDKAVVMIWEKINQYLLRSKNLQQILDPVEGIVETAEAFADSEEFAKFAEEVYGEPLPAGLERKIKISLAIQILFVSTEHLCEAVMNDPVHFLQRKKDCFYTYYHCLAIDSINDTWNDNGHIIHPEAHFSINNAYQIAISALNTVGIDENVREISSFLAEYCFCQTTLHNAMISRSSNAGLMIAATQVLEQLPYTHNLSKKFLISKK